MSFELEAPRRRDPVINISALIDVIFILMIFVILGASFERLRALGIELPESSTEDAPLPTTLTVVVPREGPPQVDGVDVQMTEIEAYLSARREQATAVLIQADREVPLQRAIDLLEAARAAGFTAVSIATRPR